jgi:hypothetical protein
MAVVIDNEDLNEGGRARLRNLVCGSVVIYRANIFDQVVFRHYVNLRHLAPRFVHGIRPTVQETQTGAVDSLILLRLSWLSSLSKAWTHLRFIGFRQELVQ